MSSTSKQATQSSDTVLISSSRGVKRKDRASPAEGGAGAVSMTSTGCRTLNDDVDNKETESSEQKVDLGERQRL